MEDEAPATSQQNRRRCRSPVPLEIIQKNISVSMAQVIVNMTNPALQAYCMQLLRINDVMQAEANISEIMKKVDAEEQKKRDAAKAKSQGRVKASGKKRTRE